MRKRSRLALLVIAFLSVVAVALNNADAGDLVPFGANWSYLHTLDGLDGDPALDDDDFVETWFTPDYDTTSPIAWSAPSPAPFAYGTAGDDGTPNVNHIAAFTPGSDFFIREVGTFLDAPEPENRFTNYFRTEFTTTEDSSNMAIRLLADDGAKIYVDGIEMISYNCCELAGPGELAEFAELANGAGSETGYAIGGVFVGQTLPAGDHVLAVEIHQAADTSDMGFSMRFYDDFVFERYIEPQDVWSYFEGTQEPSGGSLDWARPEFDDSQWKTGSEGFGFESDPANPDSVESLLGTELLDMADNYSSLYLRHDFEVPNAADMDELVLRIDYDDAFIAYVNGVEIVASNLDPDNDPTTGLPFDITGQDLGADHESSNGNGAGSQFVIDLSDLPAGVLNSGSNNVLAIHGINRFPSSDFVIAQLELLGIGESRGESGVVGDFDGDGELTALDIDALGAAIQRGDGNSLFDINNDNVVDAEDQRFWIEDLKNTYFGDANLDGEFNTRDFVLVFTADEYEDEVVGNSTWSEGDWNGDSEFNSRDFVAAFQGLGFEVGPRAVAQVPEPRAGLLLLLGAGLIAIRTRRRGFGERVERI